MHPRQGGRRGPEGLLDQKNRTQSASAAAPAVEEEEPPQPTSYQRKQRDSMQENIEHFVRHFGQEHCFEFTITGPQLDPAEFGKRLNSCLTNFLRDIMPDRIGVLEPTKSGHAHIHQLVALPFTSPDFDHEALKRSRELYNRGRHQGDKAAAAESKRLWKRVEASMSPEHRAMWNLLRKQLPQYGLGNMMSLTPVREGPRAIACYFGKYLAKGIASRPEAWRNVRLVRFSGANSKESPVWKRSTPYRASTCTSEQNRRDKVRLVAAEMGITTSEEMTEVFGSHWYFHNRDLLGTVQLGEYRSLLHAEIDGVPICMKASELRIFERHDTPGRTWVEFPEWCSLPYTPTERRPHASTPREVATTMLEVAARQRPQAIPYWRKLTGTRFLARLKC